jgi:predicted transcriptional regulator
MKNTALIKLPDMAITKIPRRTLKKSSLISDGLKKNEDFMDKFLEVYEKQMERIHKLMLMNDVLQKENEELKHHQKLLALPSAEKKQKEEKEKMLVAISYDKLKQLSTNLREIFGYDLDRVAYRNALVHIIYTLYQLKGQATPEQLFSSADLTEVTGFRYVRFLKRARFIEYRPTNKKGYYVISEAGKMFVRGELRNEIEFCEKLGVERVCLWMLD